MSDGLLTVKEVAELLRVSDESVYRLCRRGQLKATRIGSLWRIPRESVDRLLRTGLGPNGPGPAPAGDETQ